MKIDGFYIITLTVASIFGAIFGFMMFQVTHVAAILIAAL